jgi:hypothetical protein
MVDPVLVVSRSQMSIAETPLKGAADERED